MTTLDALPSKKRLLPGGWRWVRLGDVAQLINGRAYSARELLSEGKYPVLRVGNLFTSDHWYYSDLELESQKYCDKGDLLYAWSASFGPFIWAGPKVIFHYHIWKVNCGSSLHAEYARHALDIITESIKNDSHGLAMLHMTKGGMEQFEIPLPPLAEQRRIAGVLKEQMAVVEKARAAALVRLDAANTLPAAFLRTVFDASEAAGWPTKRLGEVLVRHKEIIHPGDRDGGTATFVGLEHLEPHTGRRLGGLTLDLAHLTGRKPTFRCGQIVYGYLRPYLNKVWIAEFDGCSSVDQFAYGVRSDLADVRFVAWFMRSPTYLRRSEVVTTTGQLPRIGTEQIAAVEIGLPSLDEQRAIADELDRRFATRQKLSDLLSDETNDIESLPAALLRQAFNGDL